MHNNHNATLDQWEEALEVQVKILENCQEEKLVESCMKCNLIFDCQIRREYIKAVYESMNKGASGGFEF